MDFLIKRTTELTVQEIASICRLFETVFEGHSKTIECFKEEFLHTALGYSFHAMMVDSSEIVGAHSLIPCDYLCEGSKVLVAFSVDTMIKKGYRDFFNLKDLIDLTECAAKKVGVKFIFGFPNDNSYPILKKGFKYRDIGRMNIYVYPYRIGGIKHNLSFLTPISKAFTRLLGLISVFTRKHKEIVFLWDKNRKLYDQYRYQWFCGKYKIVSLLDFNFVYRIENYEGIRTAFLTDLDKISSFNVSKAVSYIRKCDGENFDLLLYVGFLPCGNLPLVKIPRKLEPKNFNFVGKLLDKTDMDERWFDINNWNVNLSCYDLI